MQNGRLDCRIVSVQEGRSSIALLARDIPNAGIAFQIDIQGAIHYGNKTLPGKPLALHALKNQHPSTTLRPGGKAKDIVADGPMFKSYEVKGDKLVVTFDFCRRRDSCRSGDGEESPRCAGGSRRQRG
jgi:hypothetical protein